MKYFFFFRHACPVLNEVFAPYWVNNTRNQVRAILNLHPFEQYIHMEKCLYVFFNILKILHSIKYNF